MQDVWRDKKRRQRYEAYIRNFYGDEDYTLQVKSLEQMGEETNFEIADDAPAPEELIAQNILKEQLHKALTDLPPNEQALIVSHFHDEKTERQIAADLGISQQAVNKRLKKLFAKLYEILS